MCMITKYLYVGCARMACHRGLRAATDTAVCLLSKRVCHGQLTASLALS